MNKIVPLLALVAVLVLSFNVAVPVAHADSHYNSGHHASVHIQGVAFYKNPKSNTWSWNIRVVATDIDRDIKSVKFVLSVSIDIHPLTPSHPGISVGTWTFSDAVEHGFAQATFVTPHKGNGYYLFVVTAYDASNNAFLGSDWVDPQGTAG